MKVDITRECGKMLGAEIEGVTVMSWNTPVMRVVGNTLVTPVYHHLRQDHAEIFKLGHEFSEVAP